MKTARRGNLFSSSLRLIRAEYEKTVREITGERMESRKRKERKEKKKYVTQARKYLVRESRPGKIIKSGKVERKSKQQVGNPGILKRLSQ